MYKVIFFFLFSLELFAQTPQAFRYQAQARNANGQVIVNKAVVYRIQILNSLSQTVYVEDHNSTTDHLGIVNLNIGQGIRNVTYDPFDLIDWGASTYSVLQFIDFNDGNGFKNLGTTQLMNVPYALYAQNAVDVQNKLNDLEMKLYQEGVFTVSDIDGNVYKTIKIGTQIWMAENLKTTRYNDGVSVTLITQPFPWINLYQGGMRWHNDNPGAFKALFGGYYNWFAVNTGKICPTGWHVPLESEWNTLETYLESNGYGYLGSGNDIAKAMASKNQWVTSTVDGTPGKNPDANNSSFFTAIPSGNSNATNGLFEYNGNRCYWWTGTMVDVTYAVGKYMSKEQPALMKQNFDKKYGHSIRCIKD